MRTSGYIEVYYMGGIIKSARFQHYADSKRLIDKFSQELSVLFFGGYIQVKFDDSLGDRISRRNFSSWIITNYKIEQIGR